MTTGSLDGPPEQPLSERLYGRLLRLVPRAFRTEAGAEMLSVFRDGMTEARAAGPAAQTRFWTRTLLDLARTSTAALRGNRPASRTLLDLPQQRGALMPTLLKDLKFAARTLRRSPGFTLVVVVTLALGIGANAAIFSVVDGILLSPLPFPDPDRLVGVWADYTRLDGPLREWLSYPDFHDLRQLDDVFEEVGTWGSWGPTLTGVAEPQVVVGAQLSYGTLSRVLGIGPAIGRALVPDDDVPGAAAVVLLSDAFFNRSFRGDSAIVGQAISLNDEPYTVVGVMPPGFLPPFIPDADVWAPLRENLEFNSGGRGSASYLSIGRLLPDIDLATARAAVTALADRLEREYPRSNTDVGFALMPLRDDMVAGASTALWVLLGAVGFVLLMACVNVANLLLSQATSRRAEFAVRSALGASRGTIVRQLLIESSVLAASGGFLGVLIGALGTRVLVSLAPPGTPRISEVHLDLRVIAFTAAVTIASAFLLGLLPSLRATRLDLHEGLKEGGRGRDAGAQGRVLRSGLVVAQVALALVLLVGAGLFLRTFAELNRVDLGFEPENVLTVGLNLPAARYDERPAQAAFYADLERRLASLPGVDSVGAINSLPLTGNNEDANFQIEGRPPMEPGKQRVAWIRRTTDGYVETMGLNIVAGRYFEAGDDAQAPQVVAINETLARRYFPGEDPVGQRLWFGSPDSPNYRQIIGVVGDIKNFGIAQEARNAIYFPYPQVPVGFMTVVLRATGDPAALTSSVREQIRQLDPLLAASAIQPMRTVVVQSLAQERFTTTLMACFAAVALVLAVVGLYGVVSYGVNQRRREMGVRVALGASGSDIGRLVVGRSAVLIGIGLAVGIAGSLAGSRLLSGLLFGVAATDPMTYVVVVGVMVASGLAAASLPAARAARVDPIEVLSED